MKQIKKVHPQPIITFAMFLVLMFFLTGLIQADTGYKILSFKGTVKVKKGKEIIPLNQSKIVHLKRDNALMLYKGASVEILLPNRNRETITWPLYAVVSTLQKTFYQKNSLFKQEKIWKPMQRIFQEEEQIHGTTRSGPADRATFNHQINKRLADKSLNDPTLPANKIIEINAALDAVDTLFNAFPRIRRIVIKALVYRQFGLNKKALQTIMIYYKSIAPGKRKIRGQVEDYVYTEFLPIVISIEPKTSADRTVTAFHRTFSANFKLWWAAFYYNGKELIEIEKTIDTKQHPQRTFTVHKNLHAKQGQSTICIFVVVCPEWTELLSYDNIRSAKKKLLTLKETKGTTVRDYGKVTIKLCLPPAANI